MPRVKNTHRPQVFITMGDPSGVGPEIIAKALSNPSFREEAVFTCLADADIMQSAFSQFAGGMKINELSSSDEISLDEDAVNIFDPCPLLEGHTSGKPTTRGAKKALRCLEEAVEIMRTSPQEVPKALVTAPVSKEKIAEVHSGFIGHTEFLQEAYGASLVTMVFVGEHLCVIPVTRHLPLAEVASSLNEDLIRETLLQVADKRSLMTDKKDPLILVTALNPHAGEGGRMGTEEGTIIEPAIKKAKKTYSNIEGPIPADVAFYKAYNKKADIVVSMYHDQCLTAFKMLDFTSGVNMTLGLDHIRTSPDHGTAFDIAGKGIADPGSMESAIRLAVSAL